MRIERNSGFTVIELVIAIWGAFCVCAVIGIVIAAFHFILKHW